MRLSRAVASRNIFLSSVLRESSAQTDMEFTVPNITLPAMCHLVCQLVATGISMDGNVPVGNQLPQQQQPQTFPEGYLAYPDVGFAYKVCNQSVTWSDAWKRCTQEGAQLALIDSAKKVQFVKLLKRHTDAIAHVGITRMFDGSTWTAVSTGMPLLSLPWRSGEPRGLQHCVQLHFEGNGLGLWDCGRNSNYICELPIISKNTMTVN